MDILKKHLKKHKTQYIFVGGVLVGLTLAGFTLVIVKKSSIDFGEKLRINGDTIGEKLRINGDTGFINFGTIKDSVVNVVERDGRGHPGYLVRCVENGLVYTSQTSAAKALGLNQTQLSNHMTGRTPHVKGYHFERIRLAD